MGPSSAASTGHSTSQPAWAQIFQRTTVYGNNSVSASIDVKDMLDHMPNKWLTVFKASLQLTMIFFNKDLAILAYHIAQSQFLRPKAPAAWDSAVADRVHPFPAACTAQVYIFWICQTDMCNWGIYSRHGTCQQAWTAPDNQQTTLSKILVRGLTSQRPSV